MPKTRLLGNYTARENDLIRSYRLLVHAEFESYFEDRVIQIADFALKSFIHHGQAGQPLTALMTFSPLSLQATPTSLAAVNFDDPKSRVHRVIKHFIAEVRDANHGIKEPNIIKMFYPIGINRSDLDPTFMNTLNSYGSSRGASAHQSIQAQQPIDPVTETKTVSGLLEEIKKLDLKLQLLMGR